MSHRKSLQYETADSLTFIVSQFSSPTTPRKLLSEKKRDLVNPDVLWRLKVYPNGNGTAGFLALYVDIPSRHSLPEDWSCSRDITFTLHHPTDPSKSIFKRTSHTFNDEEPDWGYNQVIPVVALSQRGFLLNDSIKVTATFRVPEAAAETPTDVSVSPCGVAPQSPITPQTPELTTPRSPSLPSVTLHEFNEREDCRVIVEHFSKTNCMPCACKWHSFTDDSKFEWRLVVVPHSGAEAVSGYIDLRAKDVNDNDWEQTVSASMFLDNMENPALSVGYPFIKKFKAGKPRKGFPVLSLGSILLKEGFLANDRLCVSATAKLLHPPVPEGGEEQQPKKLPEIADAIVMDVHGFLSYDGSTPDSCMIVSPWHKLEGVGRWRFTLYPTGMKKTASNGYVSVIVAFQPSEELIGEDGSWQLRVLCEASAIRKGENADDGDSCIVLLDAQHMKVPLAKVISVQGVVEHKDDYLKWNPHFDDDDTLRVRVLLRTCGASGPKSFVVKKSMDACLRDVEAGIQSIKKALSEANKPQLVDVSDAAASWNTCMKQLEEAFKKQMDALASLGSELEYQDRLDNLNRELAALKEEEEACAGKGCPAEDLNAKEQEMRSTLKKLLLMQTTGCEGNTPPKDDSPADKPKVSQSGTKQQTIKPSVSADSVMTRSICLMNTLQSLVEQSEKVGALSSALCKIYDGLVKYMSDVEQWMAEQTKKHDEFVAQEKDLEAKCKEAQRKNQVLRGDESVLKTLTMEEVTQYIDFVMEAVGQVAVAKYLTKK